MTGGQVTVPLVVRTANGGGLGFGAQHSQAVENWAFTVPGLKIVGPVDARRRGRPDGVRDPQRRPGRVLRAQGTVRQQGRRRRPPDHVVPLGEARVAREGSRRHDGRARRHRAARRWPPPTSWPREGISAEVIDLRCLVPLDMRHRARVARTTTPAGRRRGEPLPGRLGRHRRRRSSPTRASSCWTRRCAGWPASACRCRSPTRSRSEVIPTVDKVVGGRQRLAVV